MSLARVHLCDSDVPLKEGGTIISRCYKAIPNAVFAFMADLQILGPGGMADTTECFGRICDKCDKAGGSARYQYGIIPGEESRHPEGEVA